MQVTQDNLIAPLLEQCQGAIPIVCRIHRGGQRIQGYFILYQYVICTFSYIKVRISRPDTALHATSISTLLTATGMTRVSKSLFVR